MMKGNNEVHLNTATMMQIVQEWLDRNIKESPPKVTHVREQSNGGKNAFVVYLSDEARTPDASGTIVKVAPTSSRDL